MAALPTDALLCVGGHVRGPGPDRDSRYVMHVFATCEVKYRKRFRPDWEDRNDVADFVWCLENRADTSVHEPVFPGIKTPHDVREKAIEPWDWNADSIRSTWLLNLK